MNKKNNTLKITLAILVVVLISLVSFVGVFVKDSYKMKNILPEYKLSSEFTGKKVLNISPDSTVTTKYYDKNGEEVEETKIEEGKEEEYTKEETATNPKNILTNENFDKTKKILEKRLELLGVKEYQIRKNSDSGEMYISIPDNSYSDEILSEMTPGGKFEIAENTSNSYSLITSKDLETLKKRMKDLNVEDYKVLAIKEDNKEKSTENQAANTENVESNNEGQAASETTGNTEQANKSAYKIAIVVPDSISTETAIEGISDYVLVHNEPSDNVQISANDVKSINEKLAEAGNKNYEIRKDKFNGQIFVLITEHDEVKTSEINGIKVTDGLLMDKRDIKEAKVGYGSTSNGTAIFINIQFNNAGTKKIANISKEYTNKQNEEGVVENRQVDLVLDKEILLSTHFDEEITNGLLQLTVGNASEGTKAEDLQDQIKQASNFAVLLNTENMPIKYNAGTVTFEQTNLTKDTLKVLVIFALVVIGVISIVLIIKNKKKGFYEVISLIGFVATLLVALRYTNVTITISAIIAIALAVFMNYIYTNEAMKKEKSTKDVTIKYILVYIPVLIISVVFAYIKNLQVSSFGMTMFWSLCTMIIYNALITRVLIAGSKNK